MEAPDPVACERCVAELRRHGIVSERDFRRWSLRHHPDKQGDEAIYQRVSECKQLVLTDGCEERVRRQRASGGPWGADFNGSGQRPRPGRGWEAPYGGGSKPLQVERLAEVTIALLQAVKARGVALDAHLPLSRGLRSTPDGTGRRRLLPGACGLRVLHFRPLGVPLPVRLWHEAEVLVSARAAKGERFDPQVKLGVHELLKLGVDAAGVAWQLDKKTSAHLAAVPASHQPGTAPTWRKRGIRATVRRKVAPGMRAEVGLTNASGKLRPVVGLVANSAVAYRSDENGHTLSALGGSLTIAPDGGKDDSEQDKQGGQGGARQAEGGRGGLVTRARRAAGGASDGASGAGGNEAPPPTPQAEPSESVSTSEVPHSAPYEPVSPLTSASEVQHSVPYETPPEDWYQPSSADTTTPA